MLVYIGSYQAIFYVTQKTNTVPRVNERFLINNKKYLNKECGGLMTKDNPGDHYAMMPLHYLFSFYLTLETQVPINCYTSAYYVYQTKTVACTCNICN